MEKTERKVKANGRQFFKKTNRYTKEQCKTELNRLEAANQKNSKYYRDVQSRLMEITM